MVFNLLTFVVVFYRCQSMADRKGVETRIGRLHREAAEREALFQRERAVREAEAAALSRAVREAQAALSRAEQAASEAARERVELEARVRCFPLSRLWRR